MTLLQSELLAALAQAFPDGEAWRNLADGTSLSLGRWHRDSNRLAAGLIRRDVARGDKVGLLIGDGEPLEWLVSYMAIHRAAAVAVPMLTRLAPAEHARILHDSGARMVLCSSASDAVRAAVATVVTTSAGEGERWLDVLDADADGVPRPPEADDVADIVYTSGTTGHAKGVVVRHGGLSTTGRVPETWVGSGFVCSSPFATTSGALLVCGPMRGGLSGWFLPRFDPERWLDVVDRERPVAAFLVPAMVELIVGSPRFGAADLSSLAVVTVGSAPIAPTTLRRFGEGLPQAEVLCGYGMTEFGAVTAVPLGDRGRHLGSVGLPLPGVRVRIVDASGAPLPAGSVGQVAIAGDRGPRSYLAKTEESQTWVEGWLMSGDLGRLDADGYLWITGRAKELIVRGGHNVVPREVEDTLFEHPEVAACAVTGVAHPVLGEDVAAWVVLRREVPVDDLREFLLHRLADFKVPRQITVVQELPRNESGKVMKSALVDPTKPGSAG